MKTLKEFPSGETWWTIRVRDAYGSTIYADPVRLDRVSLPLMSVQNVRTEKRYVLVQHAIRDAEPGDVILLDPATYEENIEFRGGPATLRSLDPNNPAVVAGTILRGRGASPTVTFSGPESRGCVLAGLTIQSGTIGVSCQNAVPTIRNCVVKCPDGTAVEFWWGCKPNLIGCTLLGQVKEGGDYGLVAYWKLDEAEGAIAHDSAGRYDANVMGDPIWQPGGGRLAGALRFDGMDSHVRTPFVRSPSLGAVSVFAWVKGGTPGQVILSQENGANWLMAGTPDGALKTDLKPAGRQAKSLTSTTVITDGAWHRVGLVWDGSNRILYVDDIEVVKDTQANLPSLWDGMYIGAGSALAPGTFWSGLIDDVRLYDRAVKP
jgi:hypothetical protein